VSDCAILTFAAAAYQISCRGYSAHEHSTLYSNSAVVSSSIPLDITMETLVSVALVSFGIVLGAEKLKPVTWSAWAGQIEREGGARNPYRSLEERAGFWDVRVGFKNSLSSLYSTVCGGCLLRI
jgi:hypothetical protein